MQGAICKPLSHLSPCCVIVGSQPVWKSKDWDIYDGKIMSIHWLSGTRLLTTGPEGGIVSKGQVEGQEWINLQFILQF